LQQLVDDPTRYSHSSSNILDLVAVSHPALISNLSVEREFSDHCYISFCLSKHLCDYSNVTRKVYLYGKGNFDAIRSDMYDFQSKFSHLHLNLEPLMITGLALKMSYLLLYLSM